MALYCTSAGWAWGGQGQQRWRQRASLGGVSRRESSSGLPGRSQCERQQELTSGLERAGEGMGRERERLEGQLPEHSKELAAMQAGRAPRDLQRLVHGRTLLFIEFEFSILPQTYH